MTYSKIMNSFIAIEKLQDEVVDVLEVLGFRESVSRYEAYCKALRGATLEYYDPKEDEGKARADFWKYQDVKYKPKNEGEEYK